MKKLSPKFNQINKKTWSVHNSAMNKNTSKSSCIESLCVDGVIESDPQKIG